MRRLLEKQRKRSEWKMPFRQGHIHWFCYFCQVLIIFLRGVIKPHTLNLIVLIWISWCVTTVRYNVGKWQSFWHSFSQNWQIKRLKLINIPLIPKYVFSGLEGIRKKCWQCATYENSWSLSMFQKSCKIWAVCGFKSYLKVNHSMTRSDFEVAIGLHTALGACLCCMGRKRGCPSTHCLGSKCPLTLHLICIFCQKKKSVKNVKNSILKPTLTLQK